MTANGTCNVSGGEYGYKGKAGTIPKNSCNVKGGKGSAEAPIEVTVTSSATPSGITIDASSIEITSDITIPEGSTSATCTISAHAKEWNVDPMTATATITITDNRDVYDINTAKLEFGPSGMLTLHIKDSNSFKGEAITLNKKDIIYTKDYMIAQDSLKSAIQYDGITTNKGDIADLTTLEISKENLVIPENPTPKQELHINVEFSANKKSDAPAEIPSPIKGILELTVLDESRGNSYCTGNIELRTDMLDSPNFSDIGKNKGDSVSVSGDYIDVVYNGKHSNESSVVKLNITHVEKSPALSDVNVDSISMNGILVIAKGETTAINVPLYISFGKPTKPIMAPGPCLGTITLIDNRSPAPAA